MVIKIKFMPMLIFLSKVYCFPCNLCATLNDAILRYFVGFNKSITMNEIAKNGKDGGVTAPIQKNVVIH